jgi:hypothetical protein
MSFDKKKLEEKAEHIKKQVEHEKERIIIKEVFGLIMEKWHDLSDREKEEWNNKAKKENGCGLRLFLRYFRPIVRREVEEFL